MTRGLGGHSPANVAFYLKGIDFPADRDEMLDYAEDNGAPPAVLDELERMPGGEYYSMADVMKGYGEERREAPARRDMRRGSADDRDYGRYYEEGGGYGRRGQYRGEYRQGGRSGGYEEEEEYPRMRRRRSE